MPSRRAFLALTVIAAAAPLSARAEATGSFTNEAFLKAQQAGLPILIDISATWCPTCKAQEPIIESLTSREPYADFVVLKVDFDDQRQIVREFGARSQSTLIVFKGAREVDRSVGSTDPAAIEAMLAKALNAS
jgi:thioredoxin-like negative regulator of GroEL